LSIKDYTINWILNVSPDSHRKELYLKKFINIPKKLLRKLISKHSYRIFSRYIEKTENLSGFDIDLNADMD